MLRLVVLIVSSLASVGALTVPNMGRRVAIQRVAAAAFGATSVPLTAQAAQGISKAESDAAATRSSSEFEARDKARDARKQRIAEGRKEFDSLLFKLEKSQSSAEFEDACDNLSLYLIGKGATPEELNIKGTIIRVKEKYTVTTVCLLCT